MTSLDEIRSRLTNAPLGGLQAQLYTAPGFRQIPRTVPDDAVDSAVMIVFHLHNGVPSVLLMQRTLNENDRHGGQISFPGGRKEEEDSDFLATAFRELEEETGIGQESIDVVRTISGLYIPVSNYFVQPFIAFANEQLRYRPDRSEVYELIHFPVTHFTAPRLPSKRNFQIPHSKVWIQNVPCYIFEKYKVWGATSMILSELRHMLD